MGRFPKPSRLSAPSGSEHYYFNHPGPGIKIKKSVSEIAPGVDVRGDGGMVIAPPSVKPGVGEYRWLNDMPVADAPAWLIEAASKRSKRRSLHHAPRQVKGRRPTKTSSPAIGTRRMLISKKSKRP